MDWNSIIQWILALACLGYAVYFLYQRFAGPKKKKNNTDDCSDCGCH